MEEKIRTGVNLPHYFKRKTVLTVPKKWKNSLMPSHIDLLCGIDGEL